MSHAEFCHPYQYLTKDLILQSKWGIVIIYKSSIDCDMKGIGFVYLLNLSHMEILQNV